MIVIHSVRDLIMLTRFLDGLETSYLDLERFVYFQERDLRSSARTQIDFLLLNYTPQNFEFMCQCRDSAIPTRCEDRPADADDANPNPADDRNHIRRHN